MFIEYISSYLPKSYRSSGSLKKILGKNYKRILNYTGFKKIHVIKNDKKINEFIFRSLTNFFKSNYINKKKIDCIIYSSHTRPKEMPNFSITIQKKLNLKNNILAYDLPNSCSAFTNGLIHSHAMLKSDVVKNVLLICSDFHSTKLSKKNTNLIPVVGDGLSCVLIKKDNRNPISFDYGVDGTNNQILKIENNILSMDGIKVFEFASNRVPETITRILKKTKSFKNKIDFVALHQPNKSIGENLKRQINIDFKHFISNYDHGNLSAASIPVNLCKNFPNKLVANKIFLFVGFGSGLSWSSVIIKLNKTKINKIVYL